MIMMEIGKRGGYGSEYTVLNGLFWHIKILKKIHSLDGKSFDQWKLNSGDKKLEFILKGD